MSLRVAASIEPGAGKPYAIGQHVAWPHLGHGGRVLSLRSLKINKFHHIGAVALADLKVRISTDETQLLKIAEQRAFGNAELLTQTLQ